MRKLALLLILSAGCATLRGVALEQFEVPGQPGVWFVAARGGVLANRTQVAQTWHEHVAEMCGEHAQILDSHLDEAVAYSWSRPMQVPNAPTLGGGGRTVRRPFMEGYVRCAAGASRP